MSTALLTGTLRTYHRVGCETQSLALTCPTGTIISVQSAQYTPGSMALPCFEAGSTANYNNSCSWPQALQVRKILTQDGYCVYDNNCSGLCACQKLIRNYTDFYGRIDRFTIVKKNYKISSIEKRYNTLSKDVY